MGVNMLLLARLYRLIPLVMVMLVIAFNTSCGEPWRPSSSHNKPIIGIMLNSGDESGYSIYPWYALRQNYSEVVAKAGGIPVFIGHDAESLQDYLNVLDGILLTGGNFGTPDEVFTTGVKGSVDAVKFPRSYIEFKLVQEAYARDIPILGICAGMQNMNAAMGGTLYQSLKESLGTPIEHKNEIRDKPNHSIDIIPDSVLYNITKAKSLEVNSNHQAGIKQVASVFIVNAYAPDGVIEGFEAPNKRFCMGVMWHPEFLLSSEEAAIWKAFVKQAEQYRQQRQAKL